MNMPILRLTILAYIVLVSAAAPVAAKGGGGGGHASGGGHSFGGGHEGGGSGGHGGEGGGSHPSGRPGPRPMPRAVNIEESRPAPGYSWWMFWHPPVVTHRQVDCTVKPTPQQCLDQTW